MLTYNSKHLILKQILSISLFLCLNLSAQNSVIQDSLFGVLKTETNDTLRANAHYELGWYLKLQDLQAAKLHMDTAMAAYEELKLPRKVALSHFQYSVLYRLGGDYDEAIESLSAYQDYVEHVKDTANWIFAYYEKGVIYSQQGNLEASLEQFYSANQLSESVGNEDMAATSLNSIGIVYNDLGKYIEAEESFKKALAIYKKLGVTSEHLGDVLNGLASSYKHQRKYEDAIDYFDEALKVYKNNESEFGIAIANFNKALIYNEQKEYNKALPLLNLAYEKQKSNGFNTELMLTISSLAEVNYELGNYQKSERLLNEGLQLEMESKGAAKDLYFELYRVHNKNRQYQKALEYHEVYVKYKDSLFNEENIKSINLLQKQFETEKKNKEIIQQKLELQEQETEIQKQETQITLITGLALFLLIAALLTWLVFRQKQKRKNQELIALKQEYQIKSLESLIEGEEKERFRIATELHDGVNGDLSAIKHKLNALQEYNTKTINDVVAMLDKSCDQVRAISHNLVPPALEKFDLKTATSDYCFEMNTIHSPKITFQYIGDNIKLPKNIEVNLFRIVQELVTNSVKHANATEINVQLSMMDNMLQLTVEDDGNGYDLNSIKADGIGLSNIKHRVDYLQGELDIATNSDGTYVNILIDKSSFNDN